METSFRYSELIDNIIYHDIQVLQREQVQLIFQHCAGVTADTPIKFTKFVAHHGIKIRPVNMHGVTVRGTKVTWNVDDNWYQERKAELTAKRTPKPKTEDA